MNKKNISHIVSTPAIEQYTAVIYDRLYIWNGINGQVACKNQLDKHRVFPSAPFVHFTFWTLYSVISPHGAHRAHRTNRVPGPRRAHRDHRAHKAYGAQSVPLIVTSNTSITTMVVRKKVNRIKCHLLTVVWKYSVKNIESWRSYTLLPTHNLFSEWLLSVCTKLRAVVGGTLNIGNSHYHIFLKYRVVQYIHVNKSIDAQNMYGCFS